MSIVMTGIDHSAASLDVRSLFSYTKNQMERLYGRILQEGDIDGCVMISTCNRMELWLSMAQESTWDPAGFLCEASGVDAEQYRPFFAVRRDMEAVKHLFRLAAGLESRILGEDQIVTQVREALTFARSVDASDSILEVLFRKAVTAAKRAKTEAYLSLADRSVIHTALHVLENDGIGIRGMNCMVIGNGMMGRLAAMTLKEYGANVRVTIRKYHHKAVEVPEGCLPMDYADRYTSLPDCDMIVSATSSPHYTLEYAELEKLTLPQPLYLLDLAVPRDIDPEVSQIPQIRLYDIDSFSISLQSEQLQENLRKIETILDEEIDSFLDWYNGKNCAGEIREIREAAGLDAMCRMIPYLKHVPLDGAQMQELKQEITGAAARMMNHLLFSLRTTLKREEFRDVLAAMQEIMTTEQTYKK